MTDPRVSGAHAEIRWAGSGWTVRDLGSRNGTFVDGQRLAPGAVHPLMAGSGLGLGAPKIRWRLRSAEPPAAVAIPLEGGEPLSLEEGLLALPSGEAPELCVLQDADGGWWIEEAGEIRAARDGEVLIVGTSGWRLHLPQPVRATLPRSPQAPEQPWSLSLRVSRDEEHVEAELHHGSVRIPLKPRAHLYLLLTLARQRLADRTSLPPEEQGWIHQEDLGRMLRLDDNVLYTHIFRARRQLMAAGLPTAEAVIERRAGARQLRLGIAAIEVHTP